MASPQPQPVRIATFAAPLSGNKGSASMILGLLDGCAAEGAAAAVSVFSYYPERDARLAARLDGVTVHPGHPVDLAFRLLPLLLLRRLWPGPLPARWRAALAALDACDAVAVVGGTTFADSMLYKAAWNVLAALPAYGLGKPTYFLSQTVGPVDNRLNRALAGWTLRRARHVSGRGPVSAGLVARLGVRRAANHPDLSFCMTAPGFDAVADAVPAVARLRERIADSGREPIGVAPNTIVEAKAAAAGLDYPRLMADLVEEIHRLGYLPVLIAHSYRADAASAHNNDRDLCLRIVARLPAGVACPFVDADLSSRQLRGLIGRCRLLVASRFHAMISALATGVTPVTLGWGGHKYLEVLEEFGLTQLYAGHDGLDIDTARGLLHRALAAHADLGRQIADRLPEIRRRSQAGVRLLLDGARAERARGLADG